MVKNKFYILLAGLFFLLNFNAEANIIVEASSSENEEFRAGNVADGNLKTRWSSIFKDSQWLILDLEQITEFNNIQIHWEPAHAKEYDILISNDKTKWKKIHSTSNSPGGTESIKLQKKVTAKYIKFDLKKRVTKWGFSIYEIKLKLLGEASASSVSEPELAAQNAVDGNMDTRWSSKHHDPQWLKIDFGGIKDFVGLVIYWEAAYGKSYDILFSKDDITWKKVYSTDSSDGEIDEIDFEKETARYMKIVGKQRGSYWGYSIYEIVMRTTAEPWGEGETPGGFYKKEWYFRTDPKNIGEKEKWYVFKNKLDGWKKINTGIEWKRQGFKDYNGYAWYKNIFYVPASWEKSGPLLIVNDIYKDYTLYINDTKINLSGKSGKQIQLKVKDYIKINQLNSIALKVHSPSGKGGIIGSVSLIENKEALDKKLSGLRGKNSKQYYQFLADLKPSGYSPYWLKREQGFWTVVGTDNDFKESLVYEDGSIEPYKSFSIFPFIYMDNQLITHEDVVLEQSLDKGCIPTPSVKWKHKEFNMHITVLNHGETAKSVTYAEYSIKNTGQKTIEGKLFLAIRPFEINPPWQWGGIHNIRKLEYIEKENTVSTPEYDILTYTKPTGFGAVNYNDGDIIEYIEKGKIPEKIKTEDDEGYASGVIEFKFKLEPGKEKDFFIAIPLYKDSAVMKSREDSFKSAFNKMRGELVEFWKEKLNRVEFIIPDKDILDTIRANLAYIFINKDGPAIQPGSRAYEAAWVRDGALTSSALLKMGYKKEIKEYINWYSKHIYKDGRVPAIIIIGRNEVNPVKEYDSQGELIYTILQYYQFTKDKDFLKEEIPVVLNVLKYLEYLRDQRTGKKYQNGPFYGILPNSVSHEGYYPEPGNHSHWDNFWALKGWKDAGTIFMITGRKDLINRVNREENELRQALNKSIRYSIKEKNIDYIPGCAELGDFDPTSTAISVMACNEYKNLPEFEFANTFKKYYNNVMERMKPGWTGSFTPYEIRSVQALIYLNQKSRALEIFNFLLTYRRPAGWRQWSEAVYKPVRDNGYIGDMPHTWISSGFINTVRSMFVYELEENNSLILGAGIPEDWLKNENTVGIKNAPTYWGNLSYTMKKTGNNINVKIEGDLKVPGKIILKSPLAKSIKSVKINNKAYKNFSQTEVVINKIPTEVEIQY
ncbi:MAG: discoidin domain-containing protein [Elusimicrobia bacterium]|nr:discoidin domain-containing protein [Elusimicrobiota bacterium]